MDICKLLLYMMYDIFRKGDVKVIFSRVIVYAKAWSSAENYCNTCKKQTQRK